MQVTKVFLTNGEVHSYPLEDSYYIQIDQYGNLTISREVDKDNDQVDLTGGYPKGSWIYYKSFKIQGKIP